MSVSFSHSVRQLYHERVLGCFETQADAQAYAAHFALTEYGAIDVEWDAGKLRWIVSQTVIRLFPFEIP